MFLSLFFSMTSALLSTLIQQWAREYLQYSQSSDAPHKRGRTRTYLFDGLSQFQMRRLTYGIPILLHIAVFLFFFSVSDWLYTINGLVGATARYCFIALLTVYMVLSILPLIFRNAPYQTPLTTPIRGCVSLIQVSYVILLRVVRRSSRAAGGLETRKGLGLFHHIHLDRTRALKREIERRAANLDPSAMHWLVRQLDEDDMHTFLSGLPGYILSSLTDTSLVVECLRGDNVPLHIAAQLRICITSLELSQEACMSRASAYIKSLRLISQTPPRTTASQSGSEERAIQSIIKDVNSFCEITNSPSIALRASCIRALVIREFLETDARLDTEELPTKEFPGYLKPLYRVIRVWKTTEVAQWSRLTSILPDASCPLPSDQEMWADTLYDGPLLNLAILAHAAISHRHASDEEVNPHMVWKIFETLLKTLGLAQVRASCQARTQFTEVLFNVGTPDSYHRGVPGAVLDTLNTVDSGLRLVDVLSYAPMLPQTQIEAIFGREQLRNSGLLKVFAAHLPLYVATCTPEMLEGFMEDLVLDDKLWEQLYFSLSNCSNPQLSTHNKIQIFTAVFDILDVAFEIFMDSSTIDWQSPDIDLLIGYLMEFRKKMRIDSGMRIWKVASFRVVFTSVQFCHALLTQFSIQCSRGETFYVQTQYSLSTLVRVLKLGSQEDINSWAGKKPGELDSKVAAILNEALHDGPLLNFCKLARLTLDVKLTKASDPNSENIKKSLAMLRRMLDTPHLPLVQASGKIWARFDDLRDLVRSRASHPVALESSAQNTEKLESLLEMIEELERMRAAAVKSAEATEKDDNQTGPPSDYDTQYPNDTPIPGSSMQPAEASYSEAGSPEVSNQDIPAHAPDADFHTVAGPPIPMISPYPDVGIVSYSGYEYPRTGGSDSYAGIGSYSGYEYPQTRTGGSASYYAGIGSYSGYEYPQTRTGGSAPYAGIGSYSGYEYPQTRTGGSALYAGIDTYPLYGYPRTQTGPYAGNPPYARGSRSWRPRSSDPAHLPAYGYMRPVPVRPLVSPSHSPAHPHLTSSSSSYPSYVVTVNSEPGQTVLY